MAVRDGVAASACATIEPVAVVCGSSEPLRPAPPTLLPLQVLLQTTQGEMTIDLHVDAAPRACTNFLKLCKRVCACVPSRCGARRCTRRRRFVSLCAPAHGAPPPLRSRIKYFNNVLFHNVQRNFIVQTGDPTGTGRGGDSIYKCAPTRLSRCSTRAVQPAAAQRAPTPPPCAAPGTCTASRPAFSTMKSAPN